MELDMKKLEPLLGKMVTELGAAVNGALVIIGDKLGLYAALAQRGALTPSELAELTDTSERYVREWLSAQAASGFVNYLADSGRFSLSPEQAAVFVDEESPVFMLGGFTSLAAVYADEPRLVEAFKTGKGIGWGDHCSCLFCGTERFFKPGYKAHLVHEWLPALDGVVDKLNSGARVADIGCGRGVSTKIMAEAFPKSHFTGIDFHEDSIVAAKRTSAGAPNIEFQVARAQDYRGDGFDLVTIFDALHDMGDPVGAVHHVHDTLKPDGTLMLIEPLAGDSLAENLNPVGRVYYAFSTSVCVPASLNQEVGAALGAQAGEARLRDILRTGGFSRIRRATETPFNMVLEARH